MNYYVLNKNLELERATETSSIKFIQKCTGAEGLSILLFFTRYKPGGYLELYFDYFSGLAIRVTGDKSSFSIEDGYDSRLLIDYRNSEIENLKEAVELCSLIASNFNITLDSLPVYSEIASIFSKAFIPEEPVRYIYAV